MVRLYFCRTPCYHIVRRFVSRAPTLQVSKPLFSVKPITPNDSYVSCTVFNSKGGISEVSKRFPKLPFLRDHGLFPRDLRKLDSSTIDVIPTIIIKPSCLLVNLLHIKTLIEKDRVYVFDTSTKEAATKLGVFMYDLEAKLSTSTTIHNMPSQFYEHRALESILINVMSSLDTAFKSHSTACGMILNELENEINRDKLRDLLIKSKELTSFYQTSLLIRDALDELLESDEDLAAMYLTEPRTEHDGDFSDLEMLLENYYKQCDEYVQQSAALIQDIKSTEEVVNIILDANRNSLMLFELKVTIYTLGFTVATLVPAFYGMNLKNFIEDNIWGFGGVCVFSVLSAFVVTASNFKALRRVTRLTMMSNSSFAPTSSQKAKNKLSLGNEMPEKWNRWKSWLEIALYGKSRISRNEKQSDMIWKWLLEDNKK